MHTYTKQNIRNYVVEDYDEHNEAFSRTYGFNLCYFHAHRNKGCLSGGNLFESGEALWSYIHCMGILGESNNFRKRSAKSMEPLFTYIDKECDEEIWNIDIDGYNDHTIKILCSVYEGISSKLKEINVNPTISLVTSIMLGIFGCVPSFNFCFYIWARNEFNSKRTFAAFNSKSLKMLSSFYHCNKEAFDSINLRVKTGEKWFGDKNLKETDLYPKAKLLDMYGFSRGWSYLQKRQIV